MTQRTMAQAIAETVTAYHNCVKSGNAEWELRHLETLYRLERKLPRGSGVDNGTKIELWSAEKKIVLACSFHHMDENGFYDGWTDHTITVTPTFSGIHVRVGGGRRNNIREYLADLYREALSEVTDL